MRASIPSLLLAACLAACGTEPCGEPGTYGLVVEVRDAATQAPAAAGATATASNGTYSENLGALDELHVAGLVDQAGFFQLVVTKPGYQAAHVTGIRIVDECGGEPAEVEIELVPEEG